MNQKRVAIFISGGGSNMVALVDSMTGDHPARPCFVLSNEADAGGLAKAKNRNIPTVVVDHRPFGKDRPSFEAEINRHLEVANPDFVCLAGFMRILTAEFVARWQGRLLNIHPSLLPKFKGLHTHARALAAEETAHGCTVHQVTADLDDGPILGQARLAIAPDETEATLAARVLDLEHQLYPAVVRSFAEGRQDRIDFS